MKLQIQNTKAVINYFFGKKNEISTDKNIITGALKKQVVWLKIFVVVGKSHFYRPILVHKTGPTCM